MATGFLSGLYNDVVRRFGGEAPSNRGTNVQPFQGNNPVIPPVVQPAQVQAFTPTKSSNNVVGSPINYKEKSDAIAKTLTSGDVPNYSAVAFNNPTPTIPQAQSTASELNNYRNDIATGTTDPYKWGASSGINYSPDELQAIEKATAGIYDPAINSALARLDMAQKEEARKEQFKYYLTLKQT